MTNQARWSELHGGMDPGQYPFVRRWLRLMWAAATPIARAGVPPTAVTATGVVLAGAGAAVAPRVSGGALLLASAVCDGLDGAVAVVADRATPSGAVADRVADRLSDLAYAAALARCGAPRPLVIGAAAAGLAPELIRLAAPSRRTQVTVAERPTRLICALVAIGAVAATGRRWPAGVSAAVACALGGVGVAQLARGRR